MPPKPLNTALHLPVPRSVAHMLAASSARILGLTEPQGVEGKLGVVGRLAELGFLPGECVTVLRRGPGGREPIAVQIGESVFALRRLEAACIEVDDHPLLEPA